MDCLGPLIVSTFTVNLRAALNKWCHEGMHGLSIFLFASLWFSADDIPILVLARRDAQAPSESIKKRQKHVRSCRTLLESERDRVPSRKGCVPSPWPKGNDKQQVRGFPPYGPRVSCRLFPLKNPLSLLPDEKKKAARGYHALPYYPQGPVRRHLE